MSFGKVMQMQGKHSILWTAASEGNFQLIEEIRFDVEATINECENYATPLWIASKNGHADVVRILVQFPDIDINWSNYAGVTALAAASEEGHQNVVEILMKYADVNAENEDGATPLYIAAESGHLNCVKALLPHSNPNATNQNGATPIYIACERGYIEIVQLLLSFSDVNHLDMDGWNLLHVSAYAGRLDILRLLVDTTQLNRSDKTNGGDTPLQLALDEGHQDIVDYLNGIPINTEGEILSNLWMIEAINGSAVFPRGGLLRRKRVQLRALDGCDQGKTWQVDATSPLVRSMLPLLQISMLYVQIHGLLAEYNLSIPSIDLSCYGTMVQSLAAMTWLHGSGDEWSMETDLRAIATELEAGNLSMEKTQQLLHDINHIWSTYCTTSKKNEILHATGYFDKSSTFLST